MHTSRDKSSQLKAPKKSPFSVPSDRNPHISTNRNENHLRYPHRLPLSNWGPKNEEYPSRMLSHQKGIVSGYDTASPSNQFRNEFQSRASYHLPRRLEDAERERQELLRMVYNLEEQLEKTRYLEGRSRGNLGPLPFSGELTFNSHLTRQSYNCRPKDWRHSAPLPHPMSHHSNVLPSPNPSYYSSYSYCPSSPQHYAGFELPLRSGELQFNFRRNRDYAMERHLKVKHCYDKIHLMPITGAAPFITCYCCFKLLQLPVDFLVSKRRLHQLKCGSCSEVLRFFLHDRVHLMPYTENIDHTNSQDDNY